MQMVLSSLHSKDDTWLIPGTPTHLLTRMCHLSRLPCRSGSNRLPRRLHVARCLCFWVVQIEAHEQGLQRQLVLSLGYFG